MITRRSGLALLATGFFAAALTGPVAAQQATPPPASLKPAETAILLVDFQANFTSPEGAWYSKFKEHYEKTRMLERRAR